jgi:hypothetical protein
MIAFVEILVGGSCMNLQASALLLFNFILLDRAF